MQHIYRIYIVIPRLPRCGYDCDLPGWFHSCWTLRLRYGYICVFVRWLPHCRLIYAYLFTIYVACGYVCVVTTVDYRIPVVDQPVMQPDYGYCQLLRFPVGCRLLDSRCHLVIWSYFDLPSYVPMC